MPYKMCPTCGLRHKPVVAHGAICDLRTAPDKRTRKKCPFHKMLEYGDLVTAYDTTRVFLECGVLLDYGYGYWQKPSPD